MSWADHSPEVLMLREQVKRLEAENTYLKQSHQYSGVLSYSDMLPPDTLNVSGMSHTLHLAARVGVTQEKTLGGLHVMARDFPRFGIDGASLGYYVSDLDMYHTRDRAGLLSHMLETMTRKLGAHFAGKDTTSGT